MSSIVNAVERTYEWGKERGWDTLYWAVDLHGTVLYADYQDDGIAHEFYPYAKETLQLLSKRKDTKLILFTSSKIDMLAKYTKFFADQDIYFLYANENPEVESTAHGYFEDKFYFNIMLEDKAGFEPETDWKALYNKLKEQPQL